MVLRTGSTFSGYGGLSAAVDEVFGSRTVWHSEIEPGPCKVLAHRFPGVPNLGDITKIDWSSVEPVDIIDGGSPCQDLSGASPRRAGMLEGTRSGLWESMREGIAVLRPQYVVWENVKGSLSAKARSDYDNTEVGREEGRVGGLRALGRVLGDLASLGYDASWAVIRASDAGAPHRRERVFVLASNTYRESQRFGPVTRYLADKGLSTEGAVPPALSLPGPGTTHPEDEARTHRSVEEFGPYSSVVDRWAEVVGSPPVGIIDGRLNPQFPEWMMGLPRGWVTDPAVGLKRDEQLKILGNGVVPQQAILALKILRENLEKD